MPNEISSELLWSFLLVLVRVNSVFMFVPLPGWKRAPDVSKIAAGIAFTAALFPVWPKPPNPTPEFGDLAGWVLSESAFGLVIGLSVSMLVEGFVIAAQFMGIQAGFSYASTIDPSTEADSGVIQVVCQLMAMLLIFGTPAGNEIIRSLAASFQRVPLGVWHLDLISLDKVLALGQIMWSVAVRLALPVIAVLMTLDIGIALVSRVSAQLQLLTIAFPTKLLVTIALLALLTDAFATVFREHAGAIGAWYAR
jgi:flagellar biosynthesis protein FliR